MGDFTYRTKEDVAAWKEKCPISRLRREVTARDPAAAFETIDQEVAEVVKEAREFAESSPPPEGSTATAHVYATPRSPQPAAHPPVPGDRPCTFVGRYARSP